ncbi:EAL domain-containing protein [Alteromonas sp. ASW11-36]|uniref:EAL domain-containing protein n=1 Tax=Alteromonas arenosi TaxID=3055817 RepID=A0ABT7SWG5_9ALTE|nr:EAL domain-containing protein [Alteromonas sp. ASW11-36]MDM7860530.1 EAL domain-containing protein [Alteromonas sp. ASW11-36]
MSLKSCITAFLWTLLLLITQPTLAAMPNTQFHDQSHFPIAPAFDVYIDANNQLDIQAVRELGDDQWQPETPASASFGFTQAAYWTRLELVNQSSQTQNYVVEIDYTLLDSVTFYPFRAGLAQQSIQTGDTLPFYPREIDHPSQLLGLQLAPQERVELYVRVVTDGSMLIPMRLWEERAFFESAAVAQKVHFLYYGAILVIVLINIAVFVTLRERLYLYYALATTGYWLFFATSRGYFQQLILPDSPDISSRIFLISMPALALFSLLFARQFLKTAQVTPRFDWALKAMIGFEMFNLTLAIFGDYNTVVKVSAVGAVLLFSVLFVAGPLVTRVRRTAGWYFTVAWTPLTIGFFATSGRTSGFLPNTFFTEYAMQIGSGLEALILTLALADRLYTERENKIKAQEASIQTEKARSETQMQLADALSRDPVTGCSNRNRLELLIGKTIKQSPDKKLIVALVKVSNFDDIARTLGLSRAEAILKKFARKLSEHHRDINGVVTATRFSGETEYIYQIARDTFCSVIEQAAFEEKPEKYYQTLVNLVEPIGLDGMHIDISPVYGCSLYPQHDDVPSNLIKKALIAANQSNLSAGTMTLYHDRMDIYDENQLTIVGLLRDALRNSSLNLLYQPKFDIASGKVVGIEALARWHHADLGDIFPDKFIPLAKSSGLIHELTLWAIRQALTDLNRLSELGFDGSISINICAQDLQFKHFGQEVTEILNSLEVDAQRVYLELTESDAMEDPKIGIAMLNQLAKTKVKISIDDFGTGYSSLSYLHKLPASEIKLDRSLIHDVSTDTNTAVIVSTSVMMAHALGYTVVAEGVEDQSTLDKLKEFDCDVYQGYFGGRPQSVEQLIQNFFQA